MFSELVQRLFFQDIGKVKTSLQSKWVSRSERLGSIELGSFARDSGSLSFVHITPSQSLSGRCVIFCHPISKKSKFFFSESKRTDHYIAAGDQVFLFDFNGFGQSESIDLYYWKDVVAAIEHVIRTYSPESITLHGASFGAFHMLRAMEHLPPGSTVVLENVNKSLLSYWKRWPTTSLAVRIMQCLRVRPILHMDVEQYVKNFHRKDLFIRFIACEKDDLTTVAEMRELYCWFATKNKTFTLFSDAKHLSAPIKDPALYKQIILGCEV